MNKLLILGSLLLATLACKQADFSSQARRSSESKLELGKADDFADAGDGGADTDGFDSGGNGDFGDGGKDSGFDDGSGRDSGSDGKDDGNDDGKDDDNDDGGGKDGDADEDDDGDDDGVADLFIGDDGVDEDDDGDLDEDEDEITGEEAILKITGLRRDRDDAPMLIVRRGDEEHRIAWPAKGQTIELKDICDHKDVEIEIETELRGQTFRPSQSQCFIAKENGDNSWHVGFEHDCNSNDYNKIDDTIATFTCSISDFEIEDITVNNGIPMNRWID